MNDKVDNAKAEKKKPIQVLRQRCGGASKELVARNKRWMAARRNLKAVLESGPKTIPELAEKSGLPAQETFWLVMGMKKYGAVAEGEERDGYFEYSLTADSKQE